MVANLEAARELVELTVAEEALLEGRVRPIVIARAAPAPGSPVRWPRGRLTSA